MTGSPNKPVHVWTDGSCYPNPGPGGWACIIVDGKIHKHKGYRAQGTNNVMEMTAVINALNLLSENSWVVVHCDSEYVINGITKWIKGWKERGWRKADGGEVLNQAEWKLLETAVRRHISVGWVWVRGHTGDPHNEECDRMAAEARERKFGATKYPNGYIRSANTWEVAMDYDEGPMMGPQGD